MSEKIEIEPDRTEPIEPEATRREADPKLPGRDSLFDPATLLQRQSQERLSLFFLKKYQLANLANLKILDAGCGSGGQLRRLLDYGADPHNLYGIDLSEDRIKQAQALTPLLNWLVASVEQLPFDNASFDLIFISGVMTAVLDEARRREISIEFRRVLKPQGKILWFDFAFANPRNRAVRAIKKSRVARLFPGAKIDLKRVCLAPPLVRLIAPRSYWLAVGLEGLAFLNTHLVGMISFENEEPA